MRIIKRTTLITVRYEDAVFTLRRVAPDEEVLALRDAQQHGGVPTAAGMLTILTQALTGWEGVEIDGEPQAYDPALLEHLPGGLLLNLFNAAIGLQGGDAQRGAADDPRPPSGASSPPSSVIASGNAPIPA